MLKSIEQAITGKKIPFARTPKVKNRTAAPLLYVVVPLPHRRVLGLHPVARRQRAELGQRRVRRVQRRRSPRGRSSPTSASATRSSTSGSGITGRSTSRRTASASRWKPRPTPKCSTGAPCCTTARRRHGAALRDDRARARHRGRHGSGWRQRLGRLRYSRRRSGHREHRTAGRLMSVVQREPQAPEARAAREPQRRLSPLRVIGGSRGRRDRRAGGVAGFQLWSAQADVDAKPWFAGYVDVTATPRFAFEHLGATKTPGCRAVVHRVARRRMRAPLVGRRVHARPGARIASTSTAASRGSSSRAEASPCRSAARRTTSSRSDARTSTALESAYTTVVERYQSGTIDLDLEGDGLANAAASERRATAIAALQKARRADGKPLAVWLTLPVTPSGMHLEAPRTRSRHCSPPRSTSPASTS